MPHYRSAQFSKLPAGQQFLANCQDTLLKDDIFIKLAETIVLRNRNALRVNDGELWSFNELELVRVAVKSKGKLNNVKNNKSVSKNKRK